MPVGYVIQRMSDDDGKKSIEEIHQEIIALRDSFRPTRRDVLVGGTALLAGGALVVGGSGGAAASHGGGTSGDIASAATPALHVFVDTFHFHERTTDPSSPSNGTMWYNSSA